MLLATRSALSTILVRVPVVIVQVARSRKYTPGQDDVGFVLKYECSIFDQNHPYIDLGRPMLAFTSRVRPAPNLPVRSLVGLPLPYNLTKAGPSSRFTVLSYNMLADLYAKVGSKQLVLQGMGLPAGVCWHDRVGKGGVGLLLTALAAVVQQCM